MPEKYIPEQIDPFRFAEQNLHLDGTVKIVDMHRLSARLSPVMIVGRSFAIWDR